MRYLIAILTASSLFAAGWTPQDTARESVFMGTLLFDWAQTRQIQGHPERWREFNPLIGHQPAQVNCYFLASAVLHASIAYALPPSWRHVWQYVWIGQEAACIGNNYSIGVRVSF